MLFQIHAFAIRHQNYRLFLLRFCIEENQFSLFWKQALSMPKVSSKRNFRRYLSVLYFSMPSLSCTPVMASLDRLFKLWLAGHFQMKFTFDNRTFLTCCPSVNVRKKIRVLLYLLCMVCGIHNSLHFFSYSSFTCFSGNFINALFCLLLADFIGTLWQP